MRTTAPPRRASILGAGALLVLSACVKLVGLENADPGAGVNGESDVQMGSLHISPERLEITARCGAATDARSLALQNDGAQPIEFEVHIPEGLRIALRDDTDDGTSMKGILAPGQVTLVYLKIRPSPPGSFDEDVFVAMGGRVHQIPVRIAVAGSTLSVSPSIIDFGDVRENTVGPEQRFELENTGTDAVNVLGFTGPGTDGGSDFTFSSGSVNLAPGKKATVTVSFEPGPEGPEVMATFTPQTETPTCTPAPELTLRGKRVNQDVIVSPGLVDFGEVDCNTKAGTKRTITVINYGTKAVTVSPSLEDASWFKLDDGKPVTVANAKGNVPGQKEISLTLGPVGAILGDHSEPIELTLSGAPGATKGVMAHVKIVGAILEIAPTTLTNVGGLGKTFGLTNTGNKGISIHHEWSSSRDFAVSTLGFAVPGQPTPSYVRLTAEKQGSYTTTITTVRSSGAALCEEPPTVTASGSKN